MDSSRKIIPGDQISALGHSFTVWSIFYQDHFDATYDVEFIDTENRYHHWKQSYDGGQVYRTGKPGTYFRETSGAERRPIACILPRRNGTGYTAKIVYFGGSEVSFGSFSTSESALRAIRGYSDNLTWEEM